jgi:hypothetical protein
MLLAEVKQQLFSYVSKTTYFHGWNPTHNNGKFKAGGS